jgi:DNA helicase-2/ATP-dependent DNA helicase PcrA
MSAYQEAYRRLNTAQKQAVDTTDGPVLVIAGPGTGKTQLLTTRIAHILATTDTLPENILCLTFTEAAAATMRERLSSMIGQAAYSVTISTYHAFGNDLLRRYPEFFAEAADLQPADALRIDQIMRSVQTALPYSNGLKHEVFLPDIKSLISDYKRALLTPDDVRAIASANDEFLIEATKLVRKHIGAMAKITKASLGAFEALLAAGSKLPTAGNIAAQPLVELWQTSLSEAVAQAQETGKTNALTAWKNRWLAKDGQGIFIATGRAAMRKQLAAADIYERYLRQLTKLGLYDYDDMILQAIRGLERNDDLRFTMQERYQYILLDEFQDTNEAQLRLVQLLTDNPVNEGRPNVLAVGDDDQAIYAFQGANYSHMLEFYHHYTDVLVVPLTDNYRSTADILDVSQRIGDQIAERLHHTFPAINKQLTAAGTNNSGVIERQEFLTDLSQNAWVAQKISTLIKQGTPAKDIAILAPKHQYLESLVPFLRQQNIPMHYEKREDVLTDPAISELILMSRLVVAMQQQDTSTTNALWPQILSLPFWRLATSDIWDVSWQAGQGKSWTEVLRAHEQLQPIALFFIRLSLQVLNDPLETMLDYLAGVTPLDLQEPGREPYRSPFYNYYFGNQAPAADDRVEFWQLLANLTVLRQRLKDYRGENGATPLLPDFLTFIAAHQAANIKILNTNPYQEGDNAVELMTAFKAKGQEFEAVFVLALNDEVWGSRSRTQSSRISIPENLRYIRYAGATEDERLRLVYVAFTRAKSHLYLTNFTSNFSGNSQSRLKYLDEQSGDNQEVISPFLPAASQVVQHPDTVAPSLQDLTVYWHERHHEAASSPQLKELLSGRLANLQLSATQLVRFTDASIDGPTSFLLRDLLRFPSSSSLSGIYGDSIHECLHWIQMQVANGKLPTETATLKHYDSIIKTKRLASNDANQLRERGAICLQAYLEQRAPKLQATDRSEYNFRQEGSFVGNAHLSGKIDRIIIDPEAKTITVVDFKTGRSSRRWSNDLKMLRYRQQLYFYKLLIERSTTFKGYTVTDAYLEFVEPDEEGIITELHLPMNDAELTDFSALITSVWEHIKQLNFPDVANYASDIKGTQQFQADLRENKI